MPYYTKECDKKDGKINYDEEREKIKRVGGKNNEKFFQEHVL